MIKIRTDILNELARWAGTDETRWTRSIAFRPDDCIIATDGARLVRHQHPTGGLRFAVRRAHVLAAVAAQDMMERSNDDSEMLGNDLIIGEDGESYVSGLPRHGREITIKNAGVLVTFELGDGVALTVSGETLQMPDDESIDAVSADKIEGPPPDGIVLRPLFMAAIERFIHVLGDRQGVRCVRWNGTSSPMRFQTKSGTSFTVMPMQKWLAETKTKAHQRKERRAVREMADAQQVLRDEP